MENKLVKMIGRQTKVLFKNIQITLDEIENGRLLKVCRS
jgi:hypothetical protein